MGKENERDLLEGRTLFEFMEQEKIPRRDAIAFNADKTMYAHGANSGEACAKLREKGYQGPPIIIPASSDKPQIAL